MSGGRLNRLSLHPVPTLGDEVIAVNKNPISPTALSASEAARLEGGANGPTGISPGPQVVARPARWTGGRITVLVIGVLLFLVGLVLLGAGGTGLWANLTQRDAGYVTTDAHQFSSAGSALATVRTDLGTAGVGWLYAPGLLDRVRIRVTPINASAPLFVGIGPSADVDRYLAGVNHTVIAEFFADKVEAVAGGPPGSAPGTQSFWVASDSGPGARTLVWDSSAGSWTVVVMNADGRPGISVAADLGARMPALWWIAVGVLAGGAVFAAGGALLIIDVIRRASRARTV